MDNQEHHPHVVSISSSYDGDHYIDDSELSKSAFTIFATSLVILMAIFMGSMVFAFTKMDLDGDKSFGNACLCAGCQRCKDANARVRAEEEAKRAEARQKFVTDSIARYEFLHDSLINEYRLQDSINAELAKEHKIKVDYIAFIDDGVTSRQVVVNTVTDSLSPEDMTLLGNSFGELAYTAARERQNEIDNNKEYYTKRIVNEEN
jgi:hypothetical protein